MQWDPDARSGVTNLLSILGACTGTDPAVLADRYEQYGPLKADTAEAVVEALRPLRERYAELARDPGAADSILATGAGKASALAEVTIARVKAAIGLVVL